MAIITQLNTLLFGNEAYHLYLDNEHVLYHYESPEYVDGFAAGLFSTLPVDSTFRVLEITPLDEDGFDYEAGEVWFEELDLSELNLVLAAIEENSELEYSFEEYPIYVNDRP